VNKKMNVEKLKKNTRGVIGLFIIKHEKIIISDLEFSLNYLKRIFYLKNAISYKKNLKKLILQGEKRILAVYFHQNIILGVLMEHDAKQYLIDYYIKRLLETPEKLCLSEKIPPELRDQIPYFDRPKKEILDNVSEYARQVLRCVDGQRTISQIIYELDLPLDVVIDVITSFRRSSVLHYKD
jgi:hypothetical protein